MPTPCHNKGKSTHIKEHTCTAHGPERVFIESEAFFECMFSHGLVEHIAAGEVQHSTKVLVMGNDPITQEYRRRSLNIFHFITL